MERGDVNAASSQTEAKLPCIVGISIFTTASLQSILTRFNEDVKLQHVFNLLPRSLFSVHR